MMQSGVMPLQVKGHEGLLAIAVAKKKNKKSHGIDSAPGAFGESRALPTP